MSDQPLSEDANQASYGTNAGGPANAGGAPSSSRKMQATKAQVDEVVDIMRNNVEAVLERDAKISMMDDRADALHQGASQFETQAAKLKNKFWLENMKYMIALGVVVLIFVAVAVYKYKDTAMAMVDSAKSMTGGGAVQPGMDQSMVTAGPGSYNPNQEVFQPQAPGGGGLVNEPQSGEPINGGVAQVQPLQPIQTPNVPVPQDPQTDLTSDETAPPAG